MDKTAFSKHKATAKYRGIDFKFTFEEWCEMWKPYWHNRGRKPNQYVMSRKGDVGPYSKDNCRIITWAENRAEQPPSNKLTKKLPQDDLQYINDNKHLGPVVLARKFSVDRNAMARLIGTQSYK